MSTSASSEVETTQDGGTDQRSRRGRGGVSRGGRGRHRGVRARYIDPDDLIRLQELKERRTAEIQVLLFVNNPPWKYLSVAKSIK